jgi:nucleoid DNA-binding protein
MSLTYRIIKRQNPPDRSAEPKNYIEAMSRGTVDEEQLPDAVCEDNTLNRDEARMVISRAFKKVEDFLLPGFNVRLGEMGYVHVTVKSRGVEETIKDKIIGQ